MPIPSDITGLVVWHKADAITGLADGDLLAAWPDSSGNGKVTEQPFGLKPTYETSEVNSKPVVRFGVGGDKVLRDQSLADQAAQTLFAVLRPSAIAGLQSVRSGENGGLLLRTNEGKVELVKSGTAILGASATTLTAGTAYVVAATFLASTSWAIYINGALDGSGSHAQALTSTMNAYAYLGGAGLFGGSAFLGDLAEIFVYDTVLSSTDRGAMTTYLGDKYAISVGAAGKSPPADTRRLRYRPLLVR